VPQERTVKDKLYKGMIKRMTHDLIRLGLRFRKLGPAIYCSTKHRPWVAGISNPKQFEWLLRASHCQYIRFIQLRRRRRGGGGCVLIPRRFYRFLRGGCDPHYREMHIRSGVLSVPREISTVQFGRDSGFLMVFSKRITEIDGS
jgi:hypothetical protein